MEEIAKTVSEWLMMVLCAIAAPEEKDAFRIDLVGNRGLVDTMIVKREDDHVVIQDEMNGRLVTFATIAPQADVENAYVVTDGKGKAEIVNLNKALPSLEEEALRTEERLRLKTEAGMTIAIDRSGKLLFLTPEKGRGIFVVH